MEMKSNKTIYLTETQFKKLTESFGKEMIAYHGSPADFDHFDLSFIGSGWGMQCYGHGIYLTSKKKTAENYSQGGYVYTVRIGGTGRFLKYGRPVNKNTAWHIANAFYKYYLNTEFGSEAYKGNEREFWDGECKYVAESEDEEYIYGNIASILGSDKEASKFLHDFGYTGLIWNSDGITNYVIFSPDDLEIIEKSKVEE